MNTFLDNIEQNLAFSYCNYMRSHTVTTNYIIGTFRTHCVYSVIRFISHNIQKISQKQRKRASLFSILSLVKRIKFFCEILNAFSKTRQKNTHVYNYSRVYTMAQVYSRQKSYDHRVTENNYGDTD